MESEGKYYQDMDRLAALEKGLRTWAHWVENNVDSSRTRVFFLSISPTHNKWVSLSLSQIIMLGESLCFITACWNY